MKQVHHDTLAQISDQFGELEPVHDDDSGLQIGWLVSCEEEKISFNFTMTQMRIFRIEKRSSKSQYKGLEQLRQCAKKAGLSSLVFFEHDDRTSIGNYLLNYSVQGDDGLDEIENYYKLGQLESDGHGGGLVRVGARRR